MQSLHQVLSVDIPIIAATGVFMALGGNKKEKILIFGTGSGGINFFNSCRSRYRVIGFLDNNKQKQGEKLFGLMICCIIVL